MKLSTLAAAFITIHVASQIQAQDTGGSNTGGTASQEGQTSGPSGQTDFQTDLFTGRFGYSVPLELAPARHGSTPNLEFLYNSANGNSWCGVGWDLDLGYIERETKYGVPILWSNGFPQHAYDSSKGFLFSFKNKTSDLVQLSTNVYRAQVQSDFLQFQYNTSSNTWVVIDKSGNQYYFGSSNSSRMINPKSGWSDGTATFHWALDTIITATGDKATISYTTAGEKLYPQTYSYNGHTNGVSALCTVQFHLSAFNRPDTTISCRSGYAVTNQYLLSGILHTVNGQTVWSNALNYTTSPSTGRSLLTSITRYGSDRSTTLPPITFGYSQQSFTFKSPTQWGNLYLPSGGNQDFFAVTTNNNGTTIEPGEVCDLIDMDGDGLPDRIIHPVSGAPFTSLLVQHNTGSGFANPTTWTIGSQSYDGDSTSTFEDFSLIQSTHARLVDINGDGKPDWVVDPYEAYFNGGSSNAMVTNYTRLNVQLNNSTNLMSAVSWTNVAQQLFGNDGAGEKGEFRAVENLQDPSDGNDYVQMIDMNGDGLPDRVMVRRTSPFTNYVVQFNTGSAFGPTNSFGPYQAQGYTTDLQWSGLAGNVGVSGTSPGSSMRLIDINGDGLPDRVSLLHSTVSSAAAQPQYQTNLIVELNNGYGFEPPINWTNVNSYFDQTNGGAYTSGIADLGDDYQVAYKDVNGDGLPDRIVACVFSYFDGVQTGYTNWFVQINNGTGFNKAINWGPTYNQGYNTDTEICGIQTSETTFIDINGDGLPDRVEQVYSLNESDNYFVVSLSSGPFPDLLTVASNGLGGVVSATYKPSTQYDNSESPGSSPTRQLLPFPTYTVSSISVGDGLYPSNTTTYNYTGGYWNFALRQFNGFAQTTVVDPLGTTDTHWFHQGGGRNNSAYGEYGDTTNTLGKDGMEFRTDMTGSDSFPYKTTLNQVSETVLAGGQHFAFVSTNIEVDYPASGSYYRATAKALQYDTNTGNLTNTLYYGEVGSIIVSNESFSDIGSDSYYQITQFASLANTNIVDKPQSVTLSLDLGESTILRQNNYSYDGNTGSLLQERDLICPGTYRTTSFGYDSYNNRIWETNAAGIVTQTTYDSTFETFPTQSTTAGSYTTATTYDPRSGKLTSSVNPAGLVTTNLLDVFFRLTETELSTTANGTPNHWLEQYSYTLGTSSGVPNNSVFVKQSDGVDTVNGHEVIRYSDGFGRIVQNREESETGNFRVTDTVYDARGNPEFVSLPYLGSTSTSFVRASGTELGTLHQYDPIGRPSQVSSGENGTFNSTTHLLTSIAQTGGDTGSPLGTNTIAYYNGTNPWILNVTDETGKSHQFGLDAYGRTNQIVEVTGGGNFTTTLTYNMAGDLLTVTDNASHQIQYAYNTIGELIAMADPDMGVWQYGRDAAGRLRQQIDGDGQTIKYNYTDPLGRLAYRQVYDLRSNFVYAVTNIYDSSDDGNFPVFSGQLYKVIDSQGYAKTGYDVRGRKIITARYLDANGNTYTNRYTSDDMDRITSIVYPNGGPTITNIYDKGANLYEVQQVGGSNTLFYKGTSFTALDQIAGITYGNGVAASNIYYANSHRLKSIATTKSTNIQSLAYTYDQVADIKSITDSIYSGGGSASITNITYDDLHRLTSLYRPTLSQTVNFSFDSIGNMTSSGENGGTYTYAPGLPHAVLTANGQNYAYDRCGNMLVRAGQSLVYDAENRLSAVVASNVVTTFGYDADGARLWKQSPTNTLQVWIDGNYEEKDGKILFHISAGDRVVCTFDASNTVFEYYHPDHLHSAEIMSDGSGNPYQHYEYSAYGQSRYTLSSTAFPISRRYTSQVLDEETGLYFYNARYYDPALGRFIQPDTIIPQEFNPQAYDRYAYALDNPLRFTDPTGHAGKEVADWWEGHVNRVYASLTEGSESTLYIGTVGTINSIVGGIVEPLRLGSDAGRIYATGGTPGQIGMVTLQEGLRAVSLVPVGSAIGKGGSTLINAVVRTGEEEVAGELAGVSGGCFAAGTLVLTENGDIEIQNVREGDRVWSYSFHTRQWELQPVEATPVHDYTGDLVTLTIGEASIEVTGNHPFWVICGANLSSRPLALDVPESERATTPLGRWVEARSLKPGDKLMALSASDAPIESVSSRRAHLPVYNLRVQDNHTYGVSQLGVLVHNKGMQVKPVPKADEGRLVRFGKGPETAEQLGDKAAQAEAAGLPHGVSTKLKPRISGSDKLHRSAPKSEVEKSFQVQQTGSDPAHHTVILPKPVTPEVADKFNQVFTPKVSE